MISRQPTASHSSLLQQPIASHWSIVEEVVRWWDEEEEVVLVTTQGEERRVSGRVLALHSPLLASILVEAMAKGTRVMVEASLSTLSSLLTLLTRGEVQLPTSTLGEEVLQLARELGVALGQVSTNSDNENAKNEKVIVDLEDVCTKEETITKTRETEYSNLLFEEENDLEPVELEWKLLKDNLSVVAFKQDAKKATKSTSPQKMNRANMSLDFQIQSRNGSSMDCNICPRSFKTKTKLKIHMMCHSSYYCNNCGKGFSFSSLLKRHTAQCLSENGDNEQKRLSISFNSAFLSKES